MSEKATLVVTGNPNPNEMDSVQEYLKGVMPLLMGASGKPVKRVKVDRVIKGNPSGLVLVMDFDFADAITAMFELTLTPRSSGCATRVFWR
jgi:hypothetical protein